MPSRKKAKGKARKAAKEAKAKEEESRAVVEVEADQRTMQDESVEALLHRLIINAVLQKPCINNSSLSSVAASFDDLTDMHVDIFEFLPLGDIMRLRCVCKEWKEAARKAIVPASSFNVNGVKKYNAMRVMTTALPNLQQIKFVRMKGVGWRARYEALHWWATCDIGLISNFSKLRILKFHNVPLNGKFPVFFNFPLLEKLSIIQCPNLKWDLEMLAGLPSLKELKCVNNNHQLTGNIKSLRVLRDTLEDVRIFNCRNIEGDPMELSDFPSLTMLDLRNTAVAGDIRGIGKTNFPSLAHLTLPKRVHGVEDNFQYVLSDGMLKIFVLDASGGSCNTWKIIVVNPHELTTTLWVNNLHKGLQERHICYLFGAFPPVVRVFRPKHEYGYHCSYAYVTLLAQEADDAIQVMDGTWLLGRRLQVQKCRNERQVPIAVAYGKDRVSSVL